MFLLFKVHKCKSYKHEHNEVVGKRKTTGIASWFVLLFVLLLPAEGDVGLDISSHLCLAPVLFCSYFCLTFIHANLSLYHVNLYIKVIYYAFPHTVKFLANTASYRHPPASVFVHLLCVVDVEELQRQTMLWNWRYFCNLPEH